MIKPWEKYIEKNTYKKELLKIIADISENNLDAYALVKLQ